jgi:hypothetical protein
MKCCFENSAVDTSKTEDESTIPILTDQHIQQIYKMNASRLDVHVDRYLYLKRISGNDVNLLVKVHSEGHNMYSENAEKRIKEYMKKI